MKMHLEKRSEGWGAPAQGLVRGGVVSEVCGEPTGDAGGRLQRERRRVKKTVRELLMKLAEQAVFTGR